MNFFAVAVSMERDVQLYYEKLATESTVPGVAKIFSLLAADEQRHGELLLALQRDVGHELGAESRTLEVAKDVIGTLMGDSVVAASLHNNLEAYQQALTAEAESIRFYERLAAEEQDERNRDVVECILVEEKKHYTLVENLYEFALAPTNFLAWAEFSNLREL